MSGTFLFVHVNEWAAWDSPDALPISQAYILACLRKHGFSGRILGDYRDRPLPPAEFRDAVRELRPWAIGFSVYEENINRVRVWARFAKRLAPDALVVLGGPQITMMPAAGLRQMSEADIFCRGEGETVMLSLAQALRDGRDLATVPGICFLKDGCPVETEKATGLVDLDELPSPYLEDVLSLDGMARVILLSSRGCTSPCTFCYTTRASGRQVRFHSLDRVIAEMLHLKAKGIVDFWFADPNFAYSRERLVALLERIIAEVPGVKFWCQTRYNLIDPALLDLLRRSGAHTIAFGLESADRDVLRNIKKGLEPDRLSETIRLVQQAGIQVELFTLFGLPGETISQAMRTLDYVRAHDVAVDGNSISQQLHIFHGTPISEVPAAHGIKPLPMTKPAYLAICRDFETATMGREEIRRMGLVWRLNREDYQEDVRCGRNLFEVAGFLTRNREMLAGRPEADLLLAKIYLALEEYGRAHGCLRRLQADFAETPAVRDFLAGPFIGYKMQRRATAGPGCKVIYDCRATVDGRAVPATEGYYQEAVLGDSLLLADFEQGLLGLKAGRCNQCEVLFPEDYGNRELAGRTAVFQICLHQVLEPVALAKIDDLLAAPPVNIYRFHDLAGLRVQNEKLYFLALKDNGLRGLTQDMTDFLSLLSYYLRLGFMEKAEEMLALLPPDRSLHGHAGRILLAADYPERALALLEQVAGLDIEAEVNRIKALIKLECFGEAESLAARASLAADPRVLDLRVGLASLAGLSVDEYLRRLDVLLDHQVRAMEQTATAGQCGAAVGRSGG